MPSILLPERTIAVPLLHHRWYSDGALLRMADELKPVREQWSPLVQAAIADRTEDLLTHHELPCGLLLITKVADPDCPDLRARDRGPTILRCCLLSEQQIQAISVDRTAVLQLAAVLLQALELPGDRHQPVPLYLQIPICEPDFRLPVAVDDQELQFREEVREQLRQQRQQLEKVLQYCQSDVAETSQPPRQSWWDWLLGR